MNVSLKEAAKYSEATNLQTFKFKAFDNQATNLSAIQLSYFSHIWT